MTPDCRVWILMTGVLASSAALAQAQRPEVGAELRRCENLVEPGGEKDAIKLTRPAPDREGGLVQLTGTTLKPGETQFPARTPADPVVFEDPKTGIVQIYGTQVDGRGITYLEYDGRDDPLRGAEYRYRSEDVYLPNGELLVGKEALWDVYRLSHAHLMRVFTADQLEAFYRENDLEPGSDLYFAGIALRPDGSLGDFPADNWRRRIHVIGRKANGRLQVLTSPAFNPVAGDAVPGDHIDHAYGPNFKLVWRSTPEGPVLELWMIHEEVGRKITEDGHVRDVTEIYARKMLAPGLASPEKVRLVSVENTDGTLCIDSNRGPQLGFARLIEGFRPATIEPDGIRIERQAVRTADGTIRYVDAPELAGQDWHFLTGSPGNFAGDDYDAVAAFVSGDPIQLYSMIRKPGHPDRWKRLLEGIKARYRLSWAGRGAFTQDSQGRWWLLFHAADKDIRPDGSYDGRIPPDTEAYHRNLYAVPIEFVLDLDGNPDVVLLD